MAPWRMRRPRWELLLPHFDQQMSGKLILQVGQRPLQDQKVALVVLMEGVSFQEQWARLCLLHRAVGGRALEGAR